MSATEGQTASASSFRTACEFLEVESGTKLVVFSGLWLGKGEPDHHAVTWPLKVKAS